MSLSAGTQLGRYEIRSKIGEGGMGKVYLAEDTRLKRKVALKLLPVELTTNQNRLRRFEQEARAVSALNHPNIITIHEIGEMDGLRFIVSEFIEGRTLRERMAGERLKLPVVLDVAAQVAGALAAAHAARIVHRDIKPENIMLRGDGLVKVLDFGLAKLMEASRPPVGSQLPTAARLKTEPGLVMGTPIYMSPEQARGLEIDARTDVWSLGVILYEMLAGHPPFSGETTSHILVSILEREPPLLAKLAPDVPAELQRIARKALAKDRDERYQTARDLLIDLKSLRRDLDIQSEVERSLSPGTFRVPPSGGSLTEAEGSPPEGGSQNLARSTVSVARLTAQLTKPRGLAILGLLVLAVALLSIIYFGRYFGSGSLKSGEAIKSIAVLPLANASNDPNTEYLSDGITESIINTLSQLPDLKVMARTTVFRYKGQLSDPQKVGRELGVRAVLTGRITQRGDTLIVQAELMDVSDGSQLWGEQYNRKLADVLSVQEDISREISAKLRLRLTSEEERRLAKRYTENSDAYQLYLKGLFHQNTRTEQGLKTSIDYFEQAIAKEPRYALAYTGLADSYSYLGNLNLLRPDEASTKAKTAAMQALNIDDGLAEAHTSLAYVKMNYDWDWAGADREYQRAIELNPGYPRAHSLYAWCLSARGRFNEGLAEIKRALELDPFSPAENNNVGWHLHMARRDDEAIPQFRKTMAIDPTFVRVHYYLGLAYEQKKMYGEAISQFEKWVTLAEGNPSSQAALAQAYAVAGRRLEARKLTNELEDLKKDKYVSSYELAVIYVGLGETDQALRSLQQAYEERDGWLAGWVKVDPRLDSLRSEPRFRELLRRLGHTP